MFCDACATSRYAAPMPPRADDFSSLRAAAPPPHSAFVALAHAKKKKETRSHARARRAASRVLVDAQAVLRLTSSGELTATSKKMVDAVAAVGRTVAIADLSVVTPT
jgi:hypothetical protein